ncbi:hypothetical protein [Reyranella sp.]|uniref:hypothetical protein n=1 Tax=Reyranella sp. TaxID=1929291 RepID=UPI003784ECAC
MRHLALLAGLAMAACASADATPKKAMVGADEATLVATMGRPPDVSVETVPGTRRLQWRQPATISNPTLAYSYSGGTIRPLPHTGTATALCLTEWTVERGVATDYREEGPCPAR